MPTDIWEIRQKSSMSQKVVAKDGNEAYGFYAGAHPEIAAEMAQIEVMLEARLIPKPLVPFVKLRYMLLDELRRAWFASTGSEITMLGFLLGLKSNVINAVE